MYGLYIILCRVIWYYYYYYYCTTGVFILIMPHITDTQAATTSNEELTAVTKYVITVVMGSTGVLGCMYSCMKQ